VQPTQDSLRPTRRRTSAPAPPQTHPPPGAPCSVSLRRYSVLIGCLWVRVWRHRIPKGLRLHANAGLPRRRRGWLLIRQHLLQGTVGLLEPPDFVDKPDPHGLGAD